MNVMYRWQGRVCRAHLLFLFAAGVACGQSIPLPEHPRPDFRRERWQNLNGTWDFAFDSLDVGIEKKWFNAPSFTDHILVPFPWGSNLSGVKDLADIAWYHSE